MIQVLTIELILGRHASHKIYDNSLNQALLYRLVSLMNVSDPNKTPPESIPFSLHPDRIQCSPSFQQR